MQIFFSCFQNLFLNLGMGTKDITPHTYAKWLNCSESNVSKHIRNGKFEFLPFVIRVKNWGRFYTMEVPEDLCAESFTEIKKKGFRLVLPKPTV